MAVSFRLWSSALWHRVALRIITNVSEEPDASTFRLEVKLKAGGYYETLVTTYETTCFIARRTTVGTPYTAYYHKQFKAHSS